jgi:hypothetical protein
MTLRNMLAAAAAIATIALAAPAFAGDGRHHGRHGGDSAGAGLLGFGIGAAVGSALTPSTVVVAPPPPPPYAPPPPAYPAAYAPPPWSPGWYSFCQSQYGPNFNPNTGYYLAADGGWYFCR